MNTSPDADADRAEESAKIVALAIAYDNAGLEQIKTVSIVRDDVLLIVRADWMQRITRTRLSIEVATALHNGTLDYDAISSSDLRLTFGLRMSPAVQMHPELLFQIYAPCAEDGGPCAAGWIHAAGRA